MNWLEEINLRLRLLALRSRSNVWQYSTVRLHMISILVICVILRRSILISSIWFLIERDSERERYREWERNIHLIAWMRKVVCGRIQVGLIKGWKVFEICIIELFFRLCYIVRCDIIELPCTLEMINYEERLWEWLE